jgi:hypothetical protein
MLDTTKILRVATLPQLKRAESYIAQHGLAWNVTISCMESVEFGWAEERDSR